MLSSHGDVCGVNFTNGDRSRSPADVSGSWEQELAELEQSVESCMTIAMDTAHPLFLLRGYVCQSEMLLLKVRSLAQRCCLLFSHGLPPCPVQGSGERATASYLEAKLLFNSLFCDGASVPLLRIGHRPLVSRIERVVNRMVRRRTDTCRCCGEVDHSLCVNRAVLCSPVSCCASQHPSSTHSLPCWTSSCTCKRMCCVQNAGHGCARLRSSSPRRRTWKQRQAKSRT